jgi:hypothetical protein
MAKGQPLAWRLWSRVIFRGSTDCWEFQSLKTDGYGQIWVNGRMMLAHRVAYELEHGSIPEGLDALHHCDNPCCINPEHLFLGTKADNVADMVAKGRQAKGERNGMRLHPERRPRGERHGSAKVTAEQVRDLRARFAAGGITQTQLAREAGISRYALSLLLSGRTWAHVS